jgi:hypothetical protein
VHAREVPVGRGEETSGGGHDRMPGRRRAREPEGDRAAASGIADHGDTPGGVFLQPRGAVLAVREVRAVPVSRDGRMRVRIHKSGQREPARQFLRVSGAGNHAFASKAVQEYP